MSAQRSGQSRVPFRGIFPVVALLASLWVALVIIANPAGNFPLNDDWNYARTVECLLTEHRLLITDWALTASLTHSLVGALFCLPGGFSFEALRASSIVLAFVAVVCAYLLCRRAGAPTAIAALSACVLMVNPLFFNLALTFMTDVPALAYIGVTMVLYAQILSKRVTGRKVGWGEILLATVFTTAACLTRQVALVVPLAFAVVSFCLRPPAGRLNAEPVAQRESAGNAQSAASVEPVTHRESAGTMESAASVEPARNAECAPSSDAVHKPDKPGRARVWIGALLPFVVSAAAVLSFQCWLFHQFGVLHSYTAEGAYLQDRFRGGVLLGIRASIVCFMQAAIYLGLFALPVVPLVAFDFLRNLKMPERKFAIALAVEVAVLMSIGLIFTGSAMPLADNVFFNFGVGPVTIGFYDLVLPVWPQAPLPVMLALSCVGAVGAGCLVSVLGAVAVRLRRRLPVFRSPTAAATVALCFTTLAFYLFIICVRGFFDRYLVLALFLILPCIVSAGQLVASDSSSADKDIIGEKPSGAELTAAGAEMTAGGVKPSANAAERIGAKSPVTRIAISAVLLLPLGILAVAGTHDYLSWNRARWQALNELTKTLSPMDIDGGLEFNGWYGYDPRFREAQSKSPNITMVHGRSSGVALNEIPGYTVEKRYPFDRWLPPGKAEVLVLHKYTDQPHKHKKSQ
jgi:hypothetical protein